MKRETSLPRRRFLQTALAATAGAAIAAPMIIPSSALGKDGAVAPSERITVGGIGIGNRGTYDPKDPRIHMASGGLIGNAWRSMQGVG